MHLLRRHLPFLMLLAVGPGVLSLAQTTPAGNIQGTQESRSLTTRVRGLFDFDLPSIDPPGTVKLTLHPHFGDFVRRDYMRVDTGFRWALNGHF